MNTNNSMFTLRSLNINNSRLEKTISQMFYKSVKSKHQENNSIDKNSESILKENSFFNQKLISQMAGTEYASDNVSYGLDVTEAADDGMIQIQSLLNEGRTLAIQSSNSTLTDDDRKFLNEQFSHIKNSINDVALRTEYNEFLPLVNGVYTKKIYETTGEPEVFENTKLIPGDTFEKIDITGAALDLVFIIDGSGSMGDDQQRLAENIDVLADKLKEKGVNINYAVVAYGTVDNNGAPYLQQDFTNDIEAFKKAVKDVPEYGGHEPTMSAMHFAMDKIQYRDNAIKSFVVITDEGANDAGQAAVSNVNGKQYYSYGNEISDSVNHSEGTIARLKKENITVNGVINKDDYWQDWQDYGRTGYIGEEGTITQTDGVAVDIDEPDWSKALDVIADNIEGTIKKTIITTPGSEIKEMYVIGSGTKLVDKEFENRKMVFHIGPNAFQELDSELPNEMRTYKNMDIQQTDISTRESAENTIKKIDTAIDYVNQNLANNAAKTNRLEFVQNHLENMNTVYSGMYVNKLL